MSFSSVELIQVTIEGDEEAVSVLQEAQELMSHPRILEAWERVVEYVASAVRDLAPRFKGDLSASFEEEVSFDGEIGRGLVYTDVPYAPFQERGLDPVFPNIDNITEWALANDWDPFALALQIASVGIPALHYAEEALKETEDLILYLVGDAVSEILEGTY